MISISTFKAFPELPQVALRNRIKLELNKLVDPVKYDTIFIESIKTSPYFPHYISAHGPFYDLIPPSSDEEIRELCFSKFARAIKACEKLDIRNIIFHTGWHRGFYPDNIWIENSIQFWASVMKTCGDRINVHIENVNESQIHLIKEVVSGVDRPNFRVCLDVGHLNLTDRDNITAWIVELRDHIGHFHLHNNFGIEDNHNGLGQGTIDMKAVLSVMADHCFHANWNLEIKTDFQQSIDYAKQFKNID